MNSLSVAALLLVMGCASAQYRPWYAGNGVQYPRPFNTGDAGDGLGNRGGFDSSTAPTNSKDQFGHDTKLLEEADKLPADQKPFWWLNRDQILRHIGLNPAAQTVQQPNGLPGAAFTPSAVQPTNRFGGDSPMPTRFQTIGAQPTVVYVSSPRAVIPNADSSTNYA